MYFRSSTSFLYALNISSDCIFPVWTTPFTTTSKKKKFPHWDREVSETSLISIIEYPWLWRIRFASSIEWAFIESVSFLLHFEQTAWNCICLWCYRSKREIELWMIGEVLYDFFKKLKKISIIENIHRKKIEIFFFTRNRKCLYNLQEHFPFFFSRWKRNSKKYHNEIIDFFLRLSSKYFFSHIFLKKNKKQK